MMARRKRTKMRLTAAKHIAVGLGWPLNEVRLDGDSALRDAQELARKIMKFRQCRWAGLRFTGPAQRCRSLRSGFFMSVA